MPLLATDLRNRSCSMLQSGVIQRLNLDISEYYLNILLDRLAKNNAFLSGNLIFKTFGEGPGHVINYYN